MNDSVWAALIGAGSAISATIATLVATAFAARSQADRTERQQDLRWQREEAIRLQGLQDARLRELWAQVLTTRWRVMDALDRVGLRRQSGQESTSASAAELPAAAAGQVFAVALLFFPALREAAKAFYEATVSVQIAVSSKATDDDVMNRCSQSFSDTSKSLEKLVAAQMDHAKAS